MLNSMVSTMTLSVGEATIADKVDSARAPPLYMPLAIGAAQLTQTPSGDAIAMACPGGDGCAARSRRCARYIYFQPEIISRPRTTIPAADGGESKPPAARVIPARRCARPAAAGRSGPGRTACVAALPAGTGARG